MDSDQKKLEEENIGRESNILSPTEVVQNSNPKANENIRVRTDEPDASSTQNNQGAGSEITDGEDA